MANKEIFNQNILELLAFQKENDDNDGDDDDDVTIEKVNYGYIKNLNIKRKSPRTWGKEEFLVQNAKCINHDEKWVNKTTTIQGGSKTRGNRNTKIKQNKIRMGEDICNKCLTIKTECMCSWNF